MVVLFGLVLVVSRIIVLPLIVTFVEKTSFFEIGVFGVGVVVLGVWFIPVKPFFGVLGTSIGRFVHLGSDLLCLRDFLRIL